MEANKKKQFAEDLKHPPSSSSSSEGYLTEEHVDNKYTTTEEEQEEERKEMFFAGNNNAEDEFNMSKRSYKGNFTAAKEEAYGCPYGTCGRKFVSAGQLKQHVERRHAPNIKKPSSASAKKDE